MRAPVPEAAEGRGASPQPYGHLLDHPLRPLEDVRVGRADDVVATSAEEAVALGVVELRADAGVRVAVDLDDHLLLGEEEVHDVAPHDALVAERLPPERPREVLQRDALRGGWVQPHRRGLVAVDKVEDRDVVRLTPAGREPRRRLLGWIRDVVGEGPW